MLSLALSLSYSLTRSTLTRALASHRAGKGPFSSLKKTLPLADLLLESFNPWLRSAGAIRSGVSAWLGLLTHPQHFMTSLARRLSCHFLVVLTALFTLISSHAQAQLTWTEQTSPATDQLRDVWAADASNLWIVGNGGRILKGDGSGTWTAQTSGTTSALIEVWGTSATNLWAVGTSGRILRGDGTAWTTQTSGTTEALFSLWGSSTSNVWAAGSNSTLTRWNGTSWTVSSLGVGTNVLCNGLWGSASNNIWLVGTHNNTSNGRVYRYGTSWTADTSMGTVAGLNDVWGSSANDVWAVGVGGLVLRWNGTAWSTVASGTTQELVSVWGTSPTNVYATSTDGGIFRYDGTSFTAQTSGSIERLNSIMGTSATSVFIAGGSFQVATILAGTPPPPPTLTSVSPATGITTGGTSVTLTGTGFTGATSVTFDGLAAAFTVLSPTQISATTPAHAAGAISVNVTTPNGTNPVNSLFTYVLPPPTVTEVTPAMGSTLGGTSVTLTGTGFTGATGVTFGTIPANDVIVVNATTITATTPAGAAGAVSVVVTGPGGFNAANSLYTYAVANAAPVIIGGLGEPQPPTLAENLAENTPFSGTLLATDADTPAQTLTWSKTGPDEDKFTLNPTTGAFSLIGTADFETPADAGMNGVYEVTLTVTDNGSPAASDSVALSLTITDVNDAPTVSAIAAQSTNEDTSTAAIAFTVGDQDAGQDIDELAITASSSNTTLFPAENIVLGGSGANRTLTLTPAPNANGTATITVQVSDGTVSTPRTFTLTVTPVNDAPSFTLVPSIARFPGSGPYTQADVVSAISPGPSESGNVTVALTSTNAALFTVQPTLAGTGSSRSLSFTAGSATGESTVTVQATDSDGAFTEQSFTIAITVFNMRSAGEVWTPRMTDANRKWNAITSSADGSKLAAVVGSAISNSRGQIYTSTDSGVTWTARESDRNWQSITSSADGSKLAAVAAGGQIYTSTNSGVTWTARESDRRWQSITSSADGSKLAAVVLGGQIYTSIDSGVTWEARMTDAIRNWWSITSSADGSKLAAVTGAVVSFGLIYTSTDSGVTWTPRETARRWQSITSSADGSKLVAVDSGDRLVGGQIHTSTDSGVTWTAREENRRWYSITSSADGSKLAAVDTGDGFVGGQIYTSTDSGVTWAAREENRQWRGITSSADGSKLAAVAFDGQIWTSEGSGLPDVAAGRAFTLANFSTAQAGSRVVSYTVTNSNPALFTVQPAIAANGTLTLTAGPSAGTATVSVTAKFNGGAATSPTQTFTVNVTKPLKVNERVFIVTNEVPAVQDRLIAAGATFVGVFFGSYYEAGSDLPLVLSGPDATAFDLDATTGFLEFKSVPTFPNPRVGSSGVYDVTLAIGSPTSPLGIASARVRITSNVAPTLAAIPNPADLVVSAGQQTVNLSGITAGAGETQALTVTATSGNTALIPNPTVNYSSAATTGTLTFTPVAGVSGSAVITVTVRDDQGANNSFTRSFTVTVQPPPRLVIEESATPLLTGATVAFGSQNAGSTTTKTFTLSNTGTAALSVSRISITPLSWQNSANPLDVNADGMVSPLDVLAVINRLNGGGGAGPLPAITAGTQPPPFFDVNGDGSVTALDALAVINHINAPGPIPASNSEFTLTAPAMPLTVAAGASQTFTVSFIPTQPGAKQVPLTLTSNDPDRASTLINLTGSTAAVAPGAPTIGSATAAGNASASASVSFTAPASNGGAAITGYTATSNPGGLTGTDTSSPIHVTGLSPGTPYTFTVTATNSSGPGLASAPSNSIQVGPPEIDITPPASLDFGSVLLAQAGTAKTFTVTNTGFSPLIFTPSLTGVNPGDFVLNTTGMLISLGRNQSTTFTVNFKSGALGARTAILSIASNDSDEAVTDFTLTGTATPVTPTLAATTVDQIEQTTAVASSSVTSAGGSPISERGFLYAVKTVNADPQLLGASVVKMAVDALSAQLTGLTPGTEYALRAFATNGNGTAYTPVINFTTKSGGPEIAIIDPADLELLPPSLITWKEFGNRHSDLPPEAQSGVIAISAGETHIVALKGDGSVILWKNNSLTLVPVPPEAQSGVIAISAGSRSALALKSGGSVIKWDYDSLTLEPVPPETQSGVIAISAGSRRALALKSGGSVIEWNDDGSQSTVPTAVQSGVIAIAAGWQYNLALKSDRSVISFSGSRIFQVPTAVQSDVIAMAVGRSRNVVLKSDASVISWDFDKNGHGQTRVLAAAQSGVIAIATSSNTTVALKSDGSVLNWGRRNDPFAVPPEAQSSVITISAATLDVLALKGSVVDYGAQALSSSTAKTFKLKNTGTAQLTISGITVTGDHAANFQVTNAPSSVAAGGEATFTVTFTPSATGTRSATLNVMSDDSDEATLNFPMTGGGAASANADLASLGVSAGNLVPQFDPQVKSYSLALPVGTPSFTLTPTVAQANASVTVAGSAVTSGIASAAIAFSGIAKTVSVIVTAQNGITRTYELNLSLAAGNNVAAVLGNSTPVQAGAGETGPFVQKLEVAYAIIVVNGVTLLERALNSLKTALETQTDPFIREIMKQRIAELEKEFGISSRNASANDTEISDASRLDVAQFQVTQVSTSAAPSASAPFTAEGKSEAGDFTPASTVVIGTRVIDASRILSGYAIRGYPGNAGLMTVAPGAKLRLINVTLTGGQGGALTLDGAAIINHGELVLENCTLSYNQAVKGGAIFNSSTGILTLERCTFINNTATQTGGAIHNEGQLTVRHCTFSQNSAGTSGGAIHNTGTCQITDSILAGNYCPNAAAGDVSTTGTLTLTGTNILRTLSGTATGTGTGTRLTSDPLLQAPFSLFGEPQIMPLGAGSPAINAATTSTSLLDQSFLPMEGIPDVGASEYFSLAPLVQLAAADLETNEDTISDALAFTLTDEDSSGLTYEITSQAPDLIADEDIFVFETTPGNYELFVAPQPDANGLARLLIAAHDGSNTTFEEVAVNVVPVNDAPDFVLPTALTGIVSGTGPQSYPGLVSQISAGGEDESQQTVTFSVTNNNNGLFTSQPAVSADGTLSFTAGSTFGAAIVTVQASDNGGTADGGVNTSAMKTFTITTLPGAQARLGDTVNLNLGWVTLGTGESLRVTGLPPGLAFVAGPPPRITGRVLGAAIAGGSFIQIMSGTKVVRTLPLELVTESYAGTSTYELLLEEAGQPTGRLRVTVSNPTAKVTNPAFSATLDRAGAVQRKAAGTFTAGALPQTVRVTFPAVTTTPAVSFDLVITSGSDLVTAATFPTSGLTGRGFRLARASRIPVGSPALTLTLPPALNGDRTSTPAGIGFARGTVTPAALVSLAGQLGDAQAFTSSLSLSQTNQAVVWMTPYTNKASYIGGIIDIADTGAAQRAASTDEAVTGLQWRKLADAKSTSYPAGFGPLALSADSSRWVPATTADGIAESLALDFRAIQTQYISPAAGILPTRLSLRDNYALVRLAPDNAVPFTGKITPTTGDFSGSLTLAAPATKSDFSGVLLQEDSFGSLVGQGLIKIPVTSTVAGSYQTVGIRFFQPSSLGTHRLRIGSVANINLSSISLGSGETLRLNGLPPGLALTGNAITGTVSGLGTATGVTIQVMNGTTIVRTLTLDLAVEPYAIAGRYEVLLENAGLPVGKLQVTVTSPTAKEARAAFSAVLDRIGETQRRTTGFFTASAASPLAVTVIFPAVTTFPRVTYVMSISATSNDVTGSTSPASAVTARGFRLARAGHLPVGVPALTISFPPNLPGNRTRTPGGIGNARGTITTAGAVPLTGMLGDGQAFTASLNLAQTNQAVVWVTPYKSKSSYLGGIISLAAPATPDRSLAAVSVPSSLKWARVADATALSYPLGFSALDLSALSSRWVPTTTAAALAESLGLSFRGINLSYISPTTSVLPLYLSLRDSSALLSISPSNAVPFTKGSAVGKDGSFSGTLVLPAPAQISPLSGVFLQAPTTGYTIGQGLIRVPITAPVKGSFQTIGVELQN
jgi:predicted outer membrane repeat protein